MSEPDSAAARFDRERRGNGLLDDVTTDPETGATTATYDPAVDHLGVVLPELLARCTDRDPCSLPPLYDAIDAEALDALLGDTERTGVPLRVEFEYVGYDVAVEHGRLSVTPHQ